MAEPLQWDMAVVALLGFGVWETRKAYVDSAPSLMDLRKAPKDGQGGMAQHLLDADITTGIVAAFAAVTAAYMIKSWIPILLIGGTYAGLVYYHHAVLQAPATPEGNANG